MCKCENLCILPSVWLSWGRLGRLRVVLPGGAPAFFAPLLVEAGLAPAAGLVFGAVGGLVFGFFGAGSASDWHAAGRLIIVPGPASSLSIGPAAKAAGEVAAGGTEAAEVGADCT